MCRPAQNDDCAAQTNPTPDPTLSLSLNLTPTLTLTLTLTPTPTHPVGGSGSALEVGRGSIEFTCKSEKTLHVRAIKRLVVNREHMVKC